MKNQSLSGVLYAVVAFVAWGFLPLYWKALKSVPAMEILAHRIFWSFIFVIILLFMNKRWSSFIEVMKNRKNRRAVLLSGFLISANWLLYIWAVNADHVVEASLGYYINPLISIALGMFVLKEKLNFWQLMSLCCAFIGVLVITIQFGKAPWIALFLALSFGFYGLSKKMTKLDSIVGLASETLFVAPIALVYILFGIVKGNGALFEINVGTTLLLLGAGIVTALPLIWFAKAAGKVALSTVGFIQYLAPTISLILGIFVFKEVFTPAHAISFGFIWLALVIFSISKSPYMVKRQPKLFRKNKALSG